MATTRKPSTTKKKTTTKKKPAAKVTKTAASRAKTTTKKVSVAATKAKKTTAASAVGKTTRRVRAAAERLRIWNFVLAGLYAAQAIAIVLLSRDIFVPVTTGHLTTDPISGDGTVLVFATRHLFDANIAYLLAGALGISALAHLALATIRRRRFETTLDKRINLTRWYDHALSIGLLTAVVASLVGVSDAATLLLAIGATAAASLIGRVQEADAPSSRVGYVLGAAAGLLAWLPAGLAVWGMYQYGDGGLPTYLYYLVGSSLALLIAFGVNVWLTLRASGRWANYAFADTAYSVIALVLKSAIVWQIFFGLLK